MKQCFAYLFIAILLIFTLPVKQLGQVLLKKNLTEQVDDSTDDGSDDGDGGNETAKQPQLQEEILHKCILPSYFQSLQLPGTPYAADKLILADSRLIPHFVPDIATPPPNCI